MKPDSKQIIGVFPALYVHTWTQAGEDPMVYPQPTKVTVEIVGKFALPNGVTFLGTLDTDYAVIRNKDGDVISLKYPGVYPLDTAILGIQPVAPEGFTGTIKVMANGS